MPHLTLPEIFALPLILWMFAALMIVGIVQLIRTKRMGWLALIIASFVGLVVVIWAIVAIVRAIRYQIRAFSPARLLHSRLFLQ